MAASGGGPRVGKIPKRRGPWLHAWHDAVAGLDAHGASLCAADLGGDSEHSLLVACGDKKLRVCKRLVRAGEYTLPEVPVAVRVFYTDSKAPRSPAVAVAGGSYVYIYRSLRPYFKFNLPSVEIEAVESEIWEKLQSEPGGIDAAVESLEQARDAGTRLSSRSMDLLALETPDERAGFVEKMLPIPHQQRTLVTCMEVLKQSQESDDAVSSLVIGTEHSQVLILDPPGSAIVVRVTLPAVPAYMAVTGTFEVEWRVCVACRDGKIYTIKSGDVRGTAVVTNNIIDLESQVVGLVRSDGLIYVGTMERRLQAFHVKGRSAFSLRMPAAITNMAPMLVRRSLVLSAVLVALADGEVRCYREKKLVARLQLNEPVTALYFGQYGREDNTLVAVTRSGALHIKMLQRTATLEGSVAEKEDAEQDLALPIPKKTQLYLDQTQRERELAGDMHRSFQSDLCQLRLTTARSYVKLLTDGGMGVVTGTSVEGGGAANIRLDAQVMGIGPRHRVVLRFTNSSKAALTNLYIAFLFNKNVYQMDQALLPLPILVPGIFMTRYAWINNVDPAGAADAVTVLVVAPGADAPLLNYRITMPQSELPYEG
mmetsp:Transcript_36912/g.115586  ORF Transcript_36912/g.115586 Transcript_36912/m.115586 type:complete len:596 (-) Transcript_36912:28-1815(-)